MIWGQTIADVSHYYLQLHTFIVELTLIGDGLAPICKLLLQDLRCPKQTADCCITLELVEKLPQLPTDSPLFIDEVNAVAGGIGALAVYPGDGQERLILHFAEGGIVELLLDSTESMPSGRGFLTRELVNSGRFDDLLFTALAPILRRHDYFLLHAFAAEQKGQTVLLVGQSGSGKTTTGLALQAVGWRMIGNDLALLWEENGRIVVGAIPLMLSVTPKSVELLPHIAELILDLPATPDGKVAIPAGSLNPIPTTPTPVTNILFPSVESIAQSEAVSLPAAITLVRLMEESVDRWDPALLDRHMALLGRLVEQAHAHELRLSPHLAQIDGVVGGLA